MKTYVLTIKKLKSEVELKEYESSSLKKKLNEFISFNKALEKKLNSSGSLSMFNNLINKMVVHSQLDSKIKNYGGLTTEKFFMKAHGPDARQPPESSARVTKLQRSDSNQGEVGPPKLLAASNLEAKENSQANGPHKDGGSNNEGGSLDAQNTMEPVGLTDDQRMLGLVPEASNQMVLQKEHKKGKKNKGTRTHNLVHGYLDKMANQLFDVRPVNPDIPNEQFHDLPPTQNQPAPHFNNPRPLDN
ncbi:hypothetical protein K1719_035769 [Acacia pycnantha]|nr:hypothetical protein K1719_035769 [Acacia pycnantha]